jgi:hypothetical protein
MNTNKAVNTAHAVVRKAYDNSRIIFLERLLYPPKNLRCLC